MHKAKIFHGHWLERKKLWFSKPVSIYNNRSIQPENVNTVNVLNLCGEPTTSRASNDKILEVAKYYNIITTWDTDILKCKNARFLPFGTTWISKKDWGLPKNNQFKVTTLCGGKKLTENHLKRRALWRKQKKIKMPHVFWNSSHNKLRDMNDNPVLAGKPANKMKMMKDSQFHIAIENVCEKNYFSEKLIDCFITGTIPIYCGCPNIGDYFDIKGVVQVKTVDDIIKTCNTLSTSFYENRQEHVETNFHLAQRYADNFSSRIHAIIQEYLMYGRLKK